MFRLKEKGQSVASILIPLLFIAFIVAISVTRAFPQTRFFLFILMAITLTITFINTDIALIILIFSMLLSPEIELAGTPQRAVVLRVDDILLIVIFFSWLAKLAINKQLGLFRYTRLNSRISFYILVCVFTTAIGIIVGRVHALQSSFYLLKYIEYFMLYFLVTNNLRSKRQVKFFIAAFLITCALTCAYALITSGSMGRATAPFEGNQGEPNTLGGYVIFLFALSTALSLNLSSRPWRFFCTALSCLTFVVLLQTLSRTSYVAFIPICLALVILTKKRRLLFISVLILSLLIIVPLMPDKVMERVKFTFIPGVQYETLGRKYYLDYSTSARVQTWGEVMDKWKKSPLIGYGVSSSGVIDSQYPLIMVETGVLGLWAFFWLITVIIREALRIHKHTEDEWWSGLIVGFLAGLIGLLVHAFAAASFIIVRIMEPFWFLAAIAMMIPRLNKPAETPAPEAITPLGKEIDFDQST
ncbi:O-antigen ligase family protein [Candidatus Omnitrophota bacterium]